MENKKVTLGQFFTKHSSWAQPQVIEFIQECINRGFRTIVDPFAGDGDLLQYARENFTNVKSVRGYDIDPSLRWQTNDSLVNIPEYRNGIILTNPPYLASYSARRKGEEVYSKVAKYFMNNSHEDLYQVALERMLEKYEYVVAIVPETFINSNFSKDRLKIITILESEPFDDTECPVCVCCFTGQVNAPRDVKFYKNEKYICTYQDLIDCKKAPSKIINIKFNSSCGRIALRAVDNTKNNDVIKFMPVEDLDYDIDNIKVSSRLITVIDIPEIEDYNLYSDICNEILEEYRSVMSDILLSPFKGNRKDGVRRRRLDYKTARAIMEEAFLRINKN
ncbi:MAG: hypothetical protein ACI35S_09760 [Anaeroplasma sp.]